MTATIEKPAEKAQPEYDFGYGGNSYFNGRDGVITRTSDGKSVRFNVKDGLLAVEVKEYSFGLRDEAPEDVKAMNRELPERRNEWGDTVSAAEALYERAREAFWNAAEWCCTDDPEAPDWAAGVYSAGRSGGWCAIDGTQHFAENGFPSDTPEFMLNPDGSYKAYAVVRWPNGRILDEGTTPIEGYDDYDEALARAEALSAGDDEHGYDVDEELGASLSFRDEFARLAFDIHGCIDGAHEALEELVREEHAELEARREAAIVRGDN